ncbi:hypothetical protein V1264_017493 [Littorina saxatilis]|uniref:Uncharacterized protein n=1 Tax=Littorina saxatilis TaxID=31220 RepID=A0AAN9BIG2_9CAEN
MMLRHTLLMTSAALLVVAQLVSGCANRGDLCFTSSACCVHLSCFPPNIFVSFYGVCGCPFNSKLQRFECPPYNV